MKPTPSAPNALDIKLFQAMPGNSILLLPDTPHFTVVGATDDYVRTFGKSRQELIGSPFFEAFPKTHDEKSDEIERAGRNSLEHALMKKEPHRLSNYRYDIGSDGSNGERYWSVVNRPVVNDQNEVAYIIHTAEDLTDQIKREEKEKAHQELERAYRKIEESQQALQKAHKRIVDILERTTDAFYALDAEFNFTYVNKRAEQLWGRDRESLLGKHYWTEFKKAVGSKSYQMHYKVLEEGQPVHYETISPLVGIWIEANIYPGTDGGLAVFFRDITERKATEEKLRESEALLQKRVEERTADLNHQKAFISSILDASIDGIYALKAVRNGNGIVTDFTYLFANNQVVRQLHLNAQEIVGTSMLALLPENKANGFFDLFCTLLSTGKTYRGETHFVTQQINRWFEYAIVPLGSETLVVSLEDVTEKKKAFLQMEEQRNLLDSLLKNSSNGISVSKVFRDENGRVIDALTILANDAAVKYIGLPKDIYLSKRATEIEPSVMASPYYQACIKTLETGEPFVMHYQMQSTMRWLELTVSRLDNDHLIQIFTDVTPIKEAQLQTERYVEELKRSNQNLEEFAYAASHDLREPTRKIQLFSDRLKERLAGKITDEDERLFNRIIYAAQRMDTLVEDLLTYSHVSKGAILEERVDSNEKLRLVLEDLDLEIEEAKAVVTADPLPVVKGHRRQLQQLLQNLIGNAIKYRKPGVPPQISITAREVRGSDYANVLPPASTHKSYHLITIRDNGIGFDAADAERIFNVFTRLHGNTEYKGTGVGLSIARKVAENHGGAIWAESGSGDGATFYILLPAD